MEIIIRTEQVETIVHPSTAAPAADTAALGPASSIEQSATAGAINAGPAPAPPPEAGASPANVSADEHLFAPGGTPDLSAGAAPTGHAG
jgi:hypothetical protein